MLSLFLPFLLSFFFFFCLFVMFKYKCKMVPSSWQYVFESLYLFIFNIVKQQIGHKGFVYFPFIFVIFNFMFLCNMMSLFPFGIALTSHMILMLFLSFSLCISIFVIGLMVQNLKFLRIFMPQSPFLLLFVLIPIEIFSYLISMFSLAMSLSANMLAGHTLVYIISSFIMMVVGLNSFFYLFCVVPLLFILLLEIVVAFLQAYVFTTLLCIYLNDSINFNSH